MVALEQSGADSPAVRFALTVLALDCDPNLQTCPSVNRVAKLTGLAKSTVYDALALLKRRGEVVEVTRGGGRGRTTVYSIAIAAGIFDKQSCEPSRHPRGARDVVAVVALEQSGAGTLSVRFVLAVLAIHSNADLQARPSVGRLVKLTGLSRSTVQEALHQLKARNEIFKMADGVGRSRATLYRITIADQECDQQSSENSRPSNMQMGKPLKETKGPVSGPFNGRKGPIGGAFSSEKGCQRVRSSPKKGPTIGHQQIEHMNKGRAVSREVFPDLDDQGCSGHPAAGSGGVQPTERDYRYREYVLNAPVAPLTGRRFLAPTLMKAHEPERLVHLFPELREPLQEMGFLR